MKIYMQDEWVYVPMGGKNFLCVGSKADIEKATPTEFARMVYEAWETANYHAIKCSGVHTLH